MMLFVSCSKNYIPITPLKYAVCTLAVHCVLVTSPHGGAVRELATAMCCCCCVMLYQVVVVKLNAHSVDIYE